MTRRQRSSTLFPYTTLFRSGLKTTTTSDSCASYEEKPYDGNWSSRWREALKPYSYDSTSAPFLDQGMSLSSNAASPRDRKSTRLNSSHVRISYAVFCLKKKK